MLQRLFPSLVESIQSAVRHTVMLAIAALLAAVGAGFLIATIYLLLCEWVRPPYAAAIVAGIFFALAAVLIIASKPAAKAPVPEPVVPAVPNLAETFATNLARVGFRREGLALHAAAIATRTLRPLHLLGLALVGSFLMGRRFTKR